MSVGRPSYIVGFCFLQSTLILHNLARARLLPSIWDAVGSVKVSPLLMQTGLMGADFGLSPHSGLTVTAVALAHPPDSARSISRQACL